MAVLGHPRIALDHPALDFDGTARRVEHAIELDQEAVAHHLENAPAMLHDGWIEKLAAVQTKRTHRPFFIGLHEPAVTHDIRSQYSRQTTLNLLLGHAHPLNQNYIFVIP